MAHFRWFGKLLVRLADTMGALRSAKALSLKFGERRMPWHASAGGMPGIPPSQQDIDYNLIWTGVFLAVVL